MLFGKFKSPKWKHRDVNVRKSALLSLDFSSSTNQQILIDIIQTDPDSEIRKLAVKRCSDVETIVGISFDTDNELCDDAKKRLLQLVNNDELSLEHQNKLLQQLSDNADTSFFEQLATHSGNSEFKKLAISRITRQSLLGDIALQDKDSGVRLLAAEQLHQRSTLERIAKKARKFDKRLYALIRDKINQLTPDANTSETVRDRARQINIALSVLIQKSESSADWRQFETAFHQCLSDWESNRKLWLLEFGDWDVKLDNKFAANRRCFQRQLDAQRDEEKRTVEYQHVLKPFIDRYRLINSELKALLDTVNLDGDINGDMQPVREQFHSIRQQALQLDKEVGSTAAVSSTVSGVRSLLESLQELKVVFADLCKQMQGTLGEQRARNEDSHTILHLIEQLMQMQQVKTLPNIKQLKKIQKNINKLERTSAQQQSLAKQFSTLRKLYETISKQIEQRDAKGKKALAEVEKLMSECNENLNAGQLTKLNRLQKQIDIHLAEMETFKVSTSVLEKWQRKKQDLNSKINELRDWKQWSNEPKKAKLCEEMQQLKHDLESHKDDDDYPFYEAAKQIKEARDHWKKLSKGEKHPDQRMWKQFDQTCSEAYSYCQAYFNIQSEQRKHNLEQRGQICDKLEAYALQLQKKPIESVEQKALDNIIRTAEREWRTLGVVDRSQRSNIEKRFEAVCKQLKDIAYSIRVLNLEQKQSLIKKVELLKQKHSDAQISLRELIEQTSVCQHDWKKIGRSSQQNDVWQHFKSVCDSVFKIRNQNKQAHQAQIKLNTEQRSEVIQRLSEINQFSDEELKGAAADVDAIRDRWKELQLQQSNPGLDKKYKSALQDYQRRLEVMQINEIAEQKKCFTQKCLLLSQIEHFIATLRLESSSGADIKQALQRFAQQWEELGRTKSIFSSQLNQRYAALTEILQHYMDGRAQLETDKDSMSNVEQRVRLCVEAEILAGVESDDGDSSLRAELQMQQLAEKMQQGEFFDAKNKLTQLQKAWLNNAVCCEQSGAHLETRFLKALAHVDSAYAFE